MLVDSHCHLDLAKDVQPAELVAEAVAQGVSHCLWVSVDLERFPKMLKTVQTFDNVFISLGIHPNTKLQQEPDVATLVTLANDPKVIAIGETGLDYFRSHGDMTWQKQRFRNHLQVAKEIGKPLIIHMREATQDTLEILRTENAAQVGGILHCFVEDWDIAQQAMDLGFYISFSGIVTFKQAKALQEVAKRLPLERMLVETDSPYLAPVPHRGKTNQPAYVRYVAQFIAELREESLEVVAQATTANFFRLFKTAVA
ncbi:MAG: TatD family deoxyribonuclease [Beggiatoa sp. IS2]|nr:MAG: TatD family deoxyribonuclease [Beggiatoa sp. IS2]